MRIIRVFPRRTKATPDDNLCRVDCHPGIMDEADEVHISVSFTWDIPKAEKLAKIWKSVAPVKIGGPATGQRSEEFVPGMYIKHGYTITSRGCPNKCWFCSVWKREGQGIRELPIHDGRDVLDDNLLACSNKHIKAVFSMLRKQKESVKFTGGLEAARLKDWHVQEFGKLDLSAAYFAYDTPDDLEPLQRAGRMLVDGGIITRNNAVCRCYVLAGFPKDTFEDAERRVRETTQAGFIPYIMLYRDKRGTERSGAWAEFKKRWRGNWAVMRSVCSFDRKHLFN